jgi:parvulin-like peptidyl-prolyl isomerase
MRDNMPVILFGLLITFLITIVFEWGMDYLGLRSRGGDVVGKINGRTIHYKEFADLLKSYSDNQKAQTGNDPDETQMQQARDQVWQSLVMQEILEEEIHRLGLTVTDQELVDWVRGDNPPEDLRRNFVDSTGQFRRDMYDQFLSNPNQFIRDPKGVEADFGTRWLAEYERTLRLRRLQEKLQSIVSASVRVSEGELRERFIDQNEKFGALFATFDANTLVKDDAVTLTDADVKAYYEDNLDQYRYEATRKLKYVLFPEAASGADSLARQRDIEDAAAKAKSGMDFIQLVYTYADKPDSGAYFGHGEMNPTLENAVFNAKVGDVVGPILDADGYHLLKVLDERTSGKEFIKASHILLTLQSEPDSNAVKTLAGKVAKEARAGKDFASLAKEYSKDVVSAQRGGDLGWFTRGRMTPAFEKAAFDASLGEIVGPVRTPFGLHIIKVTGRDSRELKVANITLKIAPSAQTKNDLLDRARDFAYNARESEFSKEAQQTGFDAREVQIQEKGGVIPGIGVNQAISKWAFESKVGAVSEPFTLNNGYVVCEVSEAKDAGIRTFDEVKESIRPLALRKKKIEAANAMAAELRAKLASSDSLTKIRELNPAIPVQETGQFTLAGAIPGVGRDLSFIGAVSGLQVGQISPPVQSQRGAYLIQLLSRSTFDSSAYNAQRGALESRLLQDKRNRFFADWLEKLKEKADVEDRRDVFFR